MRVYGTQAKLVQKWLEPKLLRRDQHRLFYVSIRNLVSVVPPNASRPRPCPKLRLSLNVVNHVHGQPSPGRPRLAKASNHKLRIDPKTQTSPNRPKRCHKNTYPKIKPGGWENRPGALGKLPKPRKRTESQGGDLRRNPYRTLCVADARPHGASPATHPAGHPPARLPADRPPLPRR